MAQSSIVSPLGKIGSISGGKYSEALGCGILKESLATSCSRGSRGREPIPLTPEILHLLDLLEPNKGKQARLFHGALNGANNTPLPGAGAIDTAREEDSLRS